MTPLRPILVTLAAVGSIAATTSPQPALSAYKDHARVVVMFAPTPEDPRFNAQTVQLAALTKQPTFASLLVVGVTGNTVIGVSDSAQALRQKFGVAPSDFKIVLIGKDGHVALSQTSVVTAQRIETTINSMPMRQEELRRGQVG